MAVLAENLEGENKERTESFRSHSDHPSDWLARSGLKMPHTMGGLSKLGLSQAAPTLAAAVGARFGGVSFNAFAN